MEKELNHNLENMKISPKSYLTVTSYEVEYEEKYEGSAQELLDNHLQQLRIQRNQEHQKRQREAADWREQQQQDLRELQ
jgi:uncharacterized protein YjbK